MKKCNTLCRYSKLKVCGIPMHIPHRTRAHTHTPQSSYARSFLLNRYQVDFKYNLDLYHHVEGQAAAAIDENTRLLAALSQVKNAATAFRCRTIIDCNRNLSPNLRLKVRARSRWKLRLSL